MPHRFHPTWNCVCVCVFGTWMTEDDMSLWCLVRVKQSAEPAVCLRIGYRGRIDAYNCWLRCVHQRCWRFSNQKPTSPRFPEPGRASMLCSSSSSELRLQYSDFSDSNSIKLDRKSFERSGFYSDFHTAQIARSNEISLSRSNTICVHFFSLIAHKIEFGVADLQILIHLILIVNSLCKRFA